MPIPRPELKVAVVTRKERVSGAASRWQTWRWVLAEVVPHEDGFGSAARLLYKSEDEERWLHPGYTVQLFADDAKGYSSAFDEGEQHWIVDFAGEQPCRGPARAVS